MIPQWKIYPRSQGHSTVYLQNVVTDPSIVVGECSTYDDFVHDPRDFQRNNVLYHYPINQERLVIGKFCSIACGAKFLFNSANHTLRSLSTYIFPIFYEAWGHNMSPAEAWDNKGDIVIGNDVWIGYEAVILAGVTVGDGAIIGADGKTSPDISDQLVPIRLPLMEKAYYKVDEKGEIIGDPVKKSEAIGADGKLKDGFKIEYTIRYPVTKPADDNNQGGTGGTDTVTNDIPLKNYEAPTGADDTDQTTSTVDLSWARLESIEIDKATGAITGTTKDGGIPVTVGYLAIGNVTNPNGVSHKGNSYYQAGAGAGDLTISMLGDVNQQLGIFNVNGSLYRTTGDNNQGGDEGPVLPANSEVTSAGDTKLMTGFLEAPNVDLASEISELITTQRGYQANTRIITVTDSMLEELVNMKR